MIRVPITVSQAPTVIRRWSPDHAGSSTGIGKEFERKEGFEIRVPIVVSHGPWNPREF